MRSLKNQIIAFSLLGLAACDILSGGRSLPFPTPAQHDLIVLSARGPLTYAIDDNDSMIGLEHDLVEAFALELGVGVKYLTIPQEELATRSASGEAHLAIGWLSQPENGAQQTSPPILKTRDVLVQHESSLPVESVKDLGGRTVHVVSNSRQQARMRELQKTVPDLTLIEEKGDDILAMLENVNQSRNHLAAIDDSFAELAAQYLPTLETTLELDGEMPIVWWLGPHPNAELQARLNAFLERVRHDGTLARLEDRYYGHVRRLKQADILKFLGRIESTLPKLRHHFELAQSLSGIDWRLLAATAYQESQWEPEATSPTGVRGIMMLTEETADRLGVNNRLDPRESILAGARYINLLKEHVGSDIAEPDRTWLALSAYNIGPGHFNAARQLARQLGSNPAAWYEMKRTLPLLAKPKYYQRLKAGRARGGEAVILVENIRSYYDILLRNETAYQPQIAGASTLIGLNEKLAGQGLRLH